MKISLPIKTSSPLNNSQGISRGGMIARAVKKREQRQLASHMVAAFGKSDVFDLEGGLVITLWRVAPSQGLDPEDNLPGSLKHIRDGVADGLGLKNDRDARLTWRYDQRRGKKGEYAVEIVIEPLWSTSSTPRPLNGPGAPANDS